MATSTRALAPLLRQSVCRQCMRCFSASPASFSGHNKWSKIRHHKGVEDLKKNNTRNYYSRNISLYSRLYGDNLKDNPKLANWVAAAKKAGVPKAVIEAAIAHGQGRSSDGQALEPFTFECLLPLPSPSPSVALVVEVETSNRNRALQALRTTLKRHGGTQSSTSFLFSRRGRVVFAPRRGIGVDEVLEVAIEAGAEDVVESDVESTTRADGEGEAVGETGPDARSVMLWTPPSGTSFAAKTVAERLGLEVVESDIVWAPNAETMAVVENDAAASVMKDALVALRETPDVRAVYANAARGEGVTEELWSAVEECLEA